MKIIVAGNSKEVDEGINVAQLIKAEDIENPEYVTVTINDEFIEAGTFAETVVKDNDVVEFLYFMGGGSF